MEVSEQHRDVEGRVWEVKRSSLLSRRHKWNIDQEKKNLNMDKENLLEIEENESCYK